jgi:hypothetical protein
MSKDERTEKRRFEPCEYEPYVDPIGVTHFLPPKRCKNCDD